MITALGFLEYRPTPVYDGFRWLSLAIAVLVFGLSLWLRQRGSEEFKVAGDSDRFIAIMCFECFVILSNLRALGRPFSIYILPFAVIANIYILRGITRRARGHN